MRVRKDDTGQLVIRKRHGSERPGRREHPGMRQRDGELHPAERQLGGQDQGADERGGDR